MQKLLAQVERTCSRPNRLYGVWAKRAKEESLPLVATLQAPPDEPCKRNNQYLPFIRGPVPFAESSS